MDATVMIETNDPEAVTYIPNRSISIGEHIIGPIKIEGAETLQTLKQRAHLMIKQHLEFQSLDYDKISILHSKIAHRNHTNYFDEKTRKEVDEELKQNRFQYVDWNNPSHSIEFAEKWKEVHPTQLERSFYVSYLHDYEGSQRYKTILTIKEN